MSAQSKRLIAIGAGLTVIVFVLAFINPHQEPHLRGSLLFGAVTTIVYSLWLLNSKDGDE
jgi:hypothetical protein